MIFDFKPNDEPGRLLALERLDIMDTGVEPRFERIADMVQQGVNAPMCALSFIGQDRLWLKAQRGFSGAEVAREVAICTNLLEDTTPLYIADAEADPRFADNPMVTGAPHLRSYVGAPLTTPDGYNVGALCAFDSQPREFRPHEIAMLANFAAIAMEELELRQALRPDTATGVLSRAGWLDRAAYEVERAQRYRRPLSVLVFDIDHLRKINETGGFAMGDAVIERLAALSKSIMRRTDLIGRFGGEEFAILAPETTVGGAFSLGERIRAAFAAEAVGKAQTVSATVSVGLAQLELSDADFDSLFHRADAALSQAKAEGRNQVVVADAFAAKTERVAG